MRYNLNRYHGQRGIYLGDCACLLAGNGLYTLPYTNLLLSQLTPAPVRPSQGSLQG